MLVLTRRVGDVITIGDPNSDKPPIDIELVKIQPDGTVRLGTTAPFSVRVDRFEIWEERQNEVR